MPLPGRVNASKTATAVEYEQGAGGRLFSLHFGPVVAGITLLLLQITPVHLGNAIALNYIKIISAPGIPAPTGIRCVGRNPHFGVFFFFYGDKVDRNSIQNGGAPIFSQQKNRMGYIGSINAKILANQADTGHTFRRLGGSGDRRRRVVAADAP